MAAVTKNRFIYLVSSVTAVSTSAVWRQVVYNILKVFLSNILLSRCIQIMQILLVMIKENHI
jgi:hypothetical protein